MASDVRSAAIGMQVSYGRGLILLVPTVLSVQGLTYISQFVVAGLLGPADFGTAKSIDVVLSLVVILATLGMPSLAVKCIAEIGEAEARGRLLGRLLVIALASGGATSLVTYVLLPWLVRPESVAYAQALVWVIALTTCSRTGMNYFQGVQQLGRFSSLSIGVSAVVFGLMAILVWAAGLEGWIIGRYVGEMVMLSVVLVSVWRVLKLGGTASAAHSYRQLTGAGSLIAVSLFVRTALDNLGILSLSASGEETANIGLYGVSILVVLVLLVIPGCLGNLALPKFVERLQRPAALTDAAKRTIRLTLAVTVPTTVLGIAIGPALMAMVPVEYVAAIPILQILLLTVPLRAMTTVFGTLLLASNRVRVALASNCVALAAGVLIYAKLVPWAGVLGAAWSAVATETIAVGIFGGLALRQLMNARGHRHDWTRVEFEEN